MLPHEPTRGALWIDGIAVIPRQLTVRPFEAAFLLGTSEAEIKRLLRDGRLENASRDSTKRIAIEDVAQAIEERIARGELTPLARYALLELASGRLHVHRTQVVGEAAATVAQLALKQGLSHPDSPSRRPSA